MIGLARRLAIAVVLACVMAGGAEARQAGGIEQFVGRPVVEVRFEVEGEVQTSPVLAANVQVRAGQALRLEDIRESIVGLSRRFEEVTVLAEEAPQDAPGIAAGKGVRVTFRLTPRHPINRVAFAFTAPIEISVPDLESDFRRQFGGLPNMARIGSAEETVRRLLVDQGFIDVQVSSSTITTHNPDRATLVFTVAPGELARVGSVDVRLSGSSPITREAILARSGVVVGGPYRRRALQTAMVGLQDDLRQEGYYEAIAASSDERPVGRDDLKVTLVVDSGRRVDVRFEGDSLPSSVGRVEDLVPVKRLGSVDLSLLEDAQRNVEARLRNAGYKDAKVTFAEADGAAGTRVITFTFVRGPRYRIDRVVVPPNLSIPAAQIIERLDLPPNAPFSEARITAGVTRLIVDYQQLGYARAAVTPVYTAVEQARPDENARVTVSLVVEEGARHQVASVEVERPTGSNAGGPDDQALLGLMGLHRGGPYVADVLRQDRLTIEDHLRGLGFRSATVAIAAPVFSEQNGAVGVSIVVRVDAGVQVMVGSLVVVGNQQVDESAIREEITLREGQPFGEDARIESINRLTQMGVFGTVRIEEEARLRGEPDAAVVVSVTELPRTTMGVGGGVEVSRRSRSDAEGVSRDVLDAAPRGFFEIGRRGLGGRNRSINLFTRLAIKRANLGEGDDPATDGGYGFSEYRLTGTYRERRAFRTDTELLFGLTAEQAIRTNFDFRRQSANAEVLRHITPTLSLVGRYVLDRTELFNEQIPPEDQFEIDRLFPQLRLSFFGGGVSWDRRNSLFAPSLGTLLSADFEVAPRMLGSEVGYLKSFLQASAQRPFDESRRTVVAIRGQLGMARGFEQTVATINEDGEPVLGPDGEVLLEKVADIPASQRFFGGGGTTVRGFQLDHLGAQEVLTSEGLSNGGNGLLIFNLEVRRVVKEVFGRNMAAVAFVDAGNVFRRVRDVNLKELRSAVGLGVRYDSPIGPLRFDVGFKTTRLVFGNGTRERGWEYHLSIGEAF